MKFGPLSLTLSLLLYRYDSSPIPWLNAKSTPTQRRYIISVLIEFGDVTISSCHVGNEWIMRLSRSINHSNVNSFGSIIVLFALSLVRTRSLSPFLSFLEIYFYFSSRWCLFVMFFVPLSLAKHISGDDAFCHWLCSLRIKTYRWMSQYIYFMGDRIHSIIAIAFTSFRK